uniref:Uncharacterized protein n=1 Tax=Arundo donax TaxID=35708 RepID=A0A0A8YAA9_ARUDO
MLVMVYGTESRNKNDYKYLNIFVTLIYLVVKLPYKFLPFPLNTQLHLQFTAGGNLSLACFSLPSLLSRIGGDATFLTIF